MLLYYKDEVEFKELCSKIPEYEEKRKKQEDLQNILGTRISDQTKEYLSLKDKVTPDEEVEFKLQKDILRPVTISKAKKYHRQSRTKSGGGGKWTCFEQLIERQTCERFEEWQKRQAG